MAKNIKAGCLGILVAIAVFIPENSPAQTKTILRNQPTRQEIFVNPVTGNDRTGRGTSALPYRSISMALTQAKSGTTIRLAAGTYSVANGEVFPIRLKPNVIIQGDESKQGRDRIILGGGNFLSPTLTAQNITILGANLAELRGVTVTNHNPRGYGLWLEGSSPRIIANTFRGSTQDGILILGRSAAEITKNIFLDNGANGMSIEGQSQPLISNNRFENTGYGMIIRRNAAPQVIGNTFVNNRTGVIIQPTSSPIFRNNIIERNRQTGITILANSKPDLGTIANAGNNIIRNNLQRDVQYLGNEAITAVGNQILRLSGNIQAIGTIATNPPVDNVVRTIIPDTAIVQVLPGVNPRPLPPNIAIDSNLPPITLTPPSGAIVNRTILITRAAPPPPSSLRYRVIVPTAANKTEVRRLVPSAFTSRANGQEVIQVGAFNERQAADEQRRKMLEAGFIAAIELITP